MNRFVARFSLAAAVAAAVFSSSAWAAAPGDVAPEVKVAGPKGEVVLSKLKGKVVYLDFWASWCGPCRQSFPWMNEMQTKYGAKGLQVVGINLDSKTADAEKFLAEVPAKFTIGFDPKGEAPRAYGIKGMPTAVLIGPDGKVIEQHGGFREDERGHLEEMIVKALAAK